MSPETINNPLLECETCGHATRHTFDSTEKRVYQADNDRKNYTKEYRRRVERKETMYAHIYKCLVCGSTRGYGNTVEDV